MWMGLNHMVSLWLSLAVLKIVVLSALAANWSQLIVDSHHHQQVPFPLRVRLLIMYRKSKWKCGYNLEVLGHGEFASTQLFYKNKLFYLQVNFFSNFSSREFSNYFYGSFQIKLLFTSGRFWLRLAAKSTSVEQYKLFLLSCCNYLWRYLFSNHYLFKEYMEENALSSSLDSISLQQPLTTFIKMQSIILARCLLNCTKFTFSCPNVWFLAKVISRGSDTVFTACWEWCLLHFISLACAHT